MKIIVNNIIPIKGFVAINLFGVLFVRKEYRDVFTETDERHEAIHTKQILEMLVVGFYLWYILEWLFRVLFTKDRFSHKAYRNISFEREAYENQNAQEYLAERRLFSWLKYLKKG